MIVLVDAMRSETLLSDQMPFTRSLATESPDALAFAAYAPPPTVTMPRIKGLMSGTAPAFLDMVSNLASDAIMHDNLLYQLRTYGPPGQFGLFGDDTWLRLFPRHFDRSDGTTSFFVSDTVEVDLNVTRHLDTELARDDWSLLVFHYLGLDHIGHLEGPQSPLMPAKLTEMDDVIRRTYETVRAQVEAGAPPTLLVVCSDHGMNEVRFSLQFLYF